MPTSGRSLIPKLAKVAHNGLVDVATASGALDISRRSTAMKLAALVRRGWLLRVRRGLYLILPLEAEPGRPMAVEDPWVLAREAFSPCYIGGWSAAEHWGLTEQIFRSTLVVTSANIRSRSVHLLGHEFRLFWVPTARLTGATLVWRGSERVSVSGPERTIVDCLRHPHLAGGIRHLADILREYSNTREHNFAKLATVAREAASGAAWKRLGYLVEVLYPDETALLDEAKRRIASGNVKLDPTIKSRGTLVRRWRLWVNAAIHRSLET